MSACDGPIGTSLVLPHAASTRPPPAAAASNQARRVPRVPAGGKKTQPARSQERAQQKLRSPSSLRLALQLRKKCSQ